MRTIPASDWIIIFFRVIVGYLIAGGLYRQSIAISKISNVTFLQSIPFAGLFGWLFFKEKFSFKKLILLFISYIGVILIAVKDYPLIFSFGKGEVFSFISAALFSLSFVSRKWQGKSLNDKEIVQILLFIGTIILFLVSMLRGEGFLAKQLGILFVFSILLNGFLNAINLFLINYGFARVKAVLASNILALEGVFALVLAFIFYHELPALRELLGGIVILASVIMMNKVEESENLEPPLGVGPRTSPLRRECSTN